jgi:2'-5' RNA ligase
MIQRLFTSMLPTAAIAAALVAGAVHAQPDSTKAAVRSGENVLTDKSVRKGNLFSAVSFADSAFGVEWSRLRAEAQARYPDLKLTKVEDLHITVVYIGGDWKPEDLDRIRALALVVPAVPVRLTPEVVRLGRNNQVVAVEMHGTSTAWGDSVVAAKDVLNRLGLKKPESYDTNFRTHITLAQAGHNPPTPADSTALAGFLSWMDSKIAKDPRKFTVTVGPTTRVHLLLAGTTRPDGAPEYVTVEDFLKRQLASPPGK